MIYSKIDELINYGIDAGLISAEDTYYVRNTLLAKLNLNEYNQEEIDSPSENLEELLNSITDYAVSQGLLENDSIVYRDMFDTEIMDVLTPYPREIIGKFNELYKISPKEATDYFYKLSRDTNYIRRERIARDIKWYYDTDFGNLEITINRSKPEKDPKAIAAARLQASSSYPACQLCIENEGYSGRVDHPARQNHRIIPINICGEEWGFQYSPYVYYNEHCIVLNSKHTPMVIDEKVFSKLLDFTAQFNHYVIGSNADLPIVGGSILSHEHFQGGNHIFPMMKAESEKFYDIKGFEDVEVSRLKWPMSVIRLKSTDKEKIVKLSDIILTSWRGYTDEAAYIYAETDGTPHNTLNPIVSMDGERFVMDLVLRNNITTDEHPLGVYHPHAELHHIKKENIGLIEVMGLAILPARLVEELDAVADSILNGKDMTENEKTKSHATWAVEIKENHPEINAENVQDILHQEVGKVFLDVLKDAGVYKCDDEGRAAFDRFVNQLNTEVL